MERDPVDVQSAGADFSLVDQVERLICSAEALGRRVEMLGEAFHSLHIFRSFVQVALPETSGVGCHDVPKTHLLGPVIGN